ncbi:MAG: GNAT family N-acetyltransferase [Planctomycetota bacterium]
MTDDIELRPGGPDDAAELGALYAASVHGLAADHYSERQRNAWAPRSPSVEHWRRRLEPLRVLVATRDGRAMGFIAWTDEGYVDLLYTHPDAARTGVATRLMEALEADIATKGATRLWAKASELSRPFFATRGFERVGEELIEVRGERLRSHLMERRLEAP